MTTIDVQATALTRSRYQRLSAFYDVMEGIAEGRYRPWRQKVWVLAHGPCLPGVGTGKNMAYWPKGIQITAIDLTLGLLAIAHRQLDQAVFAAYG